jgi:hypothetical protein
VTWTEFIAEAIYRIQRRKRLLMNSPTAARILSPTFLRTFAFCLFLIGSYMAARGVNYLQHIVPPPSNVTETGQRIWSQVQYARAAIPLVVAAFIWIYALSMLWLSRQRR